LSRPQAANRNVAVASNATREVSIRPITHHVPVGRGRGSSKIRIGALNVAVEQRRPEGRITPQRRRRS
jgi:hypothetical protein